jgi:hypothetical protein
MIKYIYSKRKDFSDDDIKYILSSFNGVNEEINYKYRQCKRIIKENENLHNLIFNKNIS